MAISPQCCSIISVWSFMYDLALDLTEVAEYSTFMVRSDRNSLDKGCQLVTTVMKELCLMNHRRFWYRKSAYRPVFPRMTFNALTISNLAVLVLDRILHTQSHSNADEAVLRSLNYREHTP